MRGSARNAWMAALAAGVLLVSAGGVLATTTRGLEKVSVRSPAGSEVAFYAESHALIIGVSEYTDGWPSLPGVRRDVTDVRAALEGQGFAVTVVEDPDSAGIERAFRDFINRYGQAPDNRLLFYFAGHGHTMTLAYGGDMGYLVPSNAPNPNIDQQGFIERALSMRSIEVYARTIQAKHAMFVFDSCFSGAIFEATRAIPEGIAQKTGLPVRQFITSGTAEQEVPDNSIFRAQFVAALAGDADLDGDGYITGAELGQFLERTVANYTSRAQTPQYGKLRDPLLDKGDFVFVSPNAPPPVAEAAPEVPAVPLPPAGTGGYSEQTVLTMWNAAVSSNSPALYQAFVDQFPEHPLAVAARIKIDELQPRDLAAIVPPPPAPPPPPPPATPRSDGPAVEEMSGRYVVTTNANVRTGPSTGHPRVDTLPGGTELAVTGKAVGTNWYRVGLSDGRTAFISGTLVQESGTYQGARQAVARLAPPPPRRLHEPQQQYTEDSPLEVVQAAAEAGNADAQVELGLRHAMGEGDGEQSYAEAVRWFREAAERNRVVAQYNLGVLYERGLGVAASPPEAVRWYRLAAAQGHPGAQYNLGVAFAEGRGVEQDYAAAAVLFRDAADAGLPRAMFNLGLTYEYGLGVQASENEAASWYQQAAAAGDTSAAERMAQITARREAAAAPDQTLSQSEIGGVVEQIARCWNVPSGARGASDLKIEIAVEINSDGTVRDARIVDTARYGSDDVFRAAAESARRAVLNPQCSPLRLPPDKYEAWKRTTLVFDPSRML